jgi:hypothetical protein
MLLHRPHSQLLHSNVETDSSCTPPQPKKKSSISMQKFVIIHTAKALEAIEAAIKLFALPSPYLKHSPVVTCALALAIMAQVSACNHVIRKGGNSYLAGRERIRLGLGVLKTHERYWGLARRSVAEVKNVARQLLASPVPREDVTSAFVVDVPAYALGEAMDIGVDGQMLSDLQRQDFQFGDLDLSSF